MSSNDAAYPENCPNPARVCPFDGRVRDDLMRLKRTLYGNGEPGLVMEFNLHKQSVEQQMASLSKEMRALSTWVKGALGTALTTLVAWGVTSILISVFGTGAGGKP